jgi:hypothetical protein
LACLAVCDSPAPSLGALRLLELAEVEAGSRGPERSMSFSLLVLRPKRRLQT